jgi:hypothetical protein
LQANFATATFVLFLLKFVQNEEFVSELAAGLLYLGKYTTKEWLK